MVPGKIYQLVSDKIDKIYIGSTIRTLDARLDLHEKQFEEWLTSDFATSYITSFEILKYGDYRMELLEDYPCPSHIELLQRERYYQIKNYLFSEHSIYNS